MHPLLQKLDSGDRRSIGRSNEVVADVLSRPELLPTLIEGLGLESSIIRMRSADALEKVSSKHPEYLLSYKTELLAIASAALQKEVQWHMAQIMPRLGLNHRERVSMVKVMESWLSGGSSIVNTCVMQAFAEFSKSDEKLRPGLIERIKSLAEKGTPAMKARGRKLLAGLNGANDSD